MTDLQVVVHDAAAIVVGPDETAPLDVRHEAAVVVEDGTVTAVGSSASVVREYPPENAAVSIDARGKTVLPGFVDSHTHAVFAGDRSDEFARRLRGVPYQQILAEGGGILRTVEAVQESSVTSLRDGLLDRLDTMLAHGATTVEVKSGYGLDVETELKMLEAIAAADERHPIDLVPTFLGAHAIPPDTDRETYVQRVIDEQLPAIADLATYCDVFCDDGAFTRDDAEAILRAGIDYGLRAKIHAEEFEHLGGAMLAAELGATSADHLLQATDADAQALADAGVVPTLLPGTAFTLGVEYADPDRFLDVGAWPAIASDFNPNCYSPSMCATVQFASHGMGMAPLAALRAATAEGANALDLSAAGRLTPGSPGDLLVADVPDPVHLAYRFGVNPIDTVVKGGERVYG